MHEEMDVIQLHIVGFPYRKDIEGHVSEFLAEAPGHAMTLRPHPGNAHDKQAIRAFDWQGRFVGFVSQRDLPVAWGALRSSGSQSLRGMIVSTNIEHPCALFEQQRADLMALTLWQRLLAIIKQLWEVLADMLGVNCEELSASIVRSEKMLEKYIVMAEALEELEEAA